MTIYKRLAKALQTGASLQIETEWNVYQEATITKLDGETVGFTALHPLEDVKRKFEFNFNGIKSIEF